MIGLKLNRKVPVFKSKVIQRAPVVGPEQIYLYNVMAVARRRGGEIAALDHGSLTPEWRLGLEEFGPEQAWGPRLLIVRDWNATGVVDVQERKLIWSRESWGRIWGQYLLIETPTGLDLVSPATGEVQDSIAASGRPSAVTGDIFVGPSVGQRGVFIAFDLTQRRQLWERDLFKDLSSRFGIGDAGILGVFAGSSKGRFLALSDAGFLVGGSLEDGAIVWKVDVCPNQVPLVVDGRIPFVAAGRFVVVDEETGELLCDTPHGLGLMARAQRGSLFGERVVFTSEDGRVAMFDVDSGVLVWAGEYGVSLWGSAVADDRLLVPASDGKLWVFEGENG